MITPRRAESGIDRLLHRARCGAALPGLAQGEPHQLAARCVVAGRWTLAGCQRCRAPAAGQNNPGSPIAAPNIAPFPGQPALTAPARQYAQLLQSSDSWRKL